MCAAVYVATESVFHSPRISFYLLEGEIASVETQTFLFPFPEF